MEHEPDDVHLAALIDIVARTIGVSANDVPVAGRFRDSLHIDSFSMLEVILAVESQFEVSIPDEEISQFSDSSLVEAAIWIRDAQITQPAHEDPSKSQ